MDSFISRVSHASREEEFCFLNVTKCFDGGRIDWVSKDMPKLWRYNLHYFDYLHDRDRSEESASHLISDWIAMNPSGTTDAWEPYTVSIRIVNWVKFFVRERFRYVLRRDWLESLYRQACWLERNIEYHIDANHYLKNGVALFFAGAFFDGTDAVRWLKKGTGILLEGAREQILSDGGHYERSPMYHVLVTEDFLDVLNLVMNNRRLMDKRAVSLLTGMLNNALEFLESVCLPDGEISLFNDAAIGISAHPDRVFEYAKRVIGYERKGCTAGLELTSNDASGYYVIRDGNDMMVIDSGLIGPDHQPGHAHCDILSYELAFGGRRLIVDSGVYDYETGALRAYVRSTRAHNTVMIDGQEQSELWAVFRVGRRARPISAELKPTEVGGGCFLGAHDGYKRLKGRVIHKRKIVYDGERRWKISDVIDGRGHHRVESFIHVHPDFTVDFEKNTAFIVNNDGSRLAKITFVTPGKLNTEKGWYCPGFGKKYDNEIIVFSLENDLPVELAYLIEKN